MAARAWFQRRGSIRRRPSPRQQQETFGLLLDGADAIIAEVFGPLIANGRAVLSREIGRVSTAGPEDEFEQWADFSVEPSGPNSAGVYFSFNGFGNQIDLAIGQSSWDHWEDDSRDLLPFVRDACIAARDGMVLEQSTLVDGVEVGTYAEFPRANGRPWSVEVNNFRRGPDNARRSYRPY